MPRSNRPRRRRGDTPGGASDSPIDLSQAVFGGRHTETRRGLVWNVQPISATSAVKAYTCPGCNAQIAQGSSHLVTWRADGLLGEADDLAARRHWHSHCWKIT